MSVYARHLKGYYSDILLWPFKGTITLTLLNQLSDENHHSRIIDYENIDNSGTVGNNVGFSTFISLTALSLLIQSRTHSISRMMHYISECL